VLFKYYNLMAFFRQQGSGTETDNPEPMTATFYTPPASWWNNILDTCSYTCLYMNIDGIMSIIFFISVYFHILHHFPVRGRCYHIVTDWPEVFFLPGGTSLHRVHPALFHGILN
jgi:hypothetical protein